MNKHFEIFQPWLKGWPKKFKWQWAVEYTYEHWSESQEYYSERVGFKVFETRRAAREFIRNHTTNATVKRRLVQVNWEPYNDSFSYNARGNGNGR